MLAADHRVRGFVWDAALCNRQFASLRQAKTYVVHAGLYGSQICRSGFLRCNVRVLPRTSQGPRAQPLMSCYRLKSRS